MQYWMALMPFEFKWQELISIMSERSGVKVVDRKYSDFTIRWIPIILKSVVIITCFAFNLFVRKLISPFAPFPQVRRYIESIVNLLCMRVTLIMLGIMNFECDSFAFFRKDTTKITLKSGFIGIGTHKSILDYLYYSYLLNPVFVRLIIYKKGESEELYYSPLSFIESLHCALDCRGFDPIIVRSEREYKAVKYRKLAMKTLVSECFEELNGPIFILLPGLLPKVQVSINKTVAEDIFENEIRFERSLVGFSVKMDERVERTEIYKNQLFVILEMLSRFMWLKMRVDAIEYRKWKNRYDRITYPAFVDKFYSDNEYEVEQIDYEHYLLQLDRLFSGVEDSKEQ